MSNLINIDVANNVREVNVSVSDNSNNINIDVVEVIRNINVEVSEIGMRGATGEGIPPGGDYGQLLAKKTHEDYDTEWITIDKASVGLSEVDNTSDANKPISTATQDALDLKAPIDSPSFTGDVYAEGYTVYNYTGNRLLLDSGNLLEPNLENDTRFLSSTSLGEPEGNPPVWELITKSTFGLENVDNTSDLNKPISNDTQAALDLKLENSFETISKNLKSFNYTFNYTGELLSSITYDTLDGDIIKTFNYTDDKLTSIVLSGEIPLGIYSTKTFTYSGEELINITYS
jgi:hypothetical protein